MQRQKHPFWTIPKLWDGATCFILGGGVSLAEMDLAPIHGRRVIGVNQAFELGDWVDICWFGDARWYQNNQEALMGFPGLRACCGPPNRTYPGVKLVRRGEGDGLCKKPNTVCWNKNSGASAINFAYHLGVKTAVLLGFDFHATEGRHNWHDKHDRFASSPKTNIYTERFFQPMRKLARDVVGTVGFSVLNATPGTSLDVFPKTPLEAVL